MTGVIVTTPPITELPPGSASGPANLPAVTYQFAVTGAAQTWTGVQTFGPGTFQFAGSISGVTTLQAQAAAGGILTVPNGSDTLVGRATSPTWTGNHTFNPASGDAITINPAAGASAKSLVVTQAFTGTSVAGPVAGSLFNITNSATCSTAGSDGFGIFNENIAGARLNFSMNAGGPLVQNAMLIAGRLTATNAGDSMGLNSSMYSNIASTGNIYGIVGNAFIDASGSGSRALACELDVAIATGGSATYRVGLNLTSYGNVLGTTLDTGLMLSGNALLAPGTGFGKGITLSKNIYGVAPIVATGDVLYVDSAQTVANVFNCTNLTVTGFIFNFPNFSVVNTNNQNAATQASITNSSGGTGAFAHWLASNGTNNMTVGIGGTAATPALYTGRGYLTANGTAPLVVGTAGNQPVIQIVNNAEIGRWDNGAPGRLNLGVTGSIAGGLLFNNVTSGNITLSPTTGALGNAILTLPAVTATLLTTGNTGGTISTATNSLGADVALNNTANYFDGPSTTQGASGTWSVSGKVTLTDTVGAGSFACKLWDGTTVIDSCTVGAFGGANSFYVAQLSGVITSPAGNLRISVKDTASTSGKILFNQSGNSKDSTITAIRIN